MSDRTHAKWVYTVHVAAPQRTLQAVVGVLEDRSDASAVAVKATMEHVRTDSLNQVMGA